MGTRGLTVVVKDGEHRVAQYGQWDHYPTGQGTRALGFCCDHLDTPEKREAFKAAVDKCRFISDDEAGKLWKACGADDSGWVGADVADKFEARHPQLHRDAGAKVLSMILTGKDEHGRKAGPELQDSLDFGYAGNNGFGCEGIYVVDLDRNVLEVYYGYSMNDEYQGSLHNLRPRVELECPLLARFDLTKLPPKSVVPAIMEAVENMINKFTCDDTEDYSGPDDTPDMDDLDPNQVAAVAMAYALGDDAPEDCSVYRRPATNRIVDLLNGSSAYDPTGVPYLNVQDILTDLRHYCDTHKLNFSAISGESCKRHKGQADMDARLAKK